MIIARTLSRSIRVYDSLIDDPVTLRSAVRQEMAHEPSVERHFVILRRSSIHLGSLRAIRLVSSSGEKEGSLIEDDIIAVRPDGTVYHLQLLTPKANYAADKLLFDQVASGFRVVPENLGECSND